MQACPLVVYDRPYCVWEWDLTDRNLRFLDRVDPQYFRYVADSNYALLDSDDRQRAAVAIRLGYHHGLESLFALIGSVLQAPQCVPAWLQKYETGQLRDLVTEISKGSNKLVNALGLSKVSWVTVANRMMAVKYASDEKTEETKREFARLWGRLAADYLDPVQTSEYNSMKHGLRIKPGGFQIAVGLEKEFGKPAPQDEMKPLGGSQFGSSFFMAEQPSGSIRPKRDPNFRIRSMSVNWNPESLALRLHLIAMSLGNVLSFAKILNGIDPTSVSFTRPQDVKEFSHPWQYSVGVLNCSMDTEVCDGDITPMSSEAIIAALTCKTPESEAERA